jgi:leucyl aminopeptidase (aminopeptidase T)
LSELSRSEAEQIAHFLVAESIHVRKRRDGSGESVIIRYNTTDQSCVDFALMVEEECWKRGAHTLMRPGSFARERIKLSSKPEDALREVEPLVLRIAETTDIDIYIGECDDPNFTAGLVDRWRLGAPSRQKYREIMDDRNVRWAYVGWPLPSAALGYGLDQQEFRRILFNSIRQSFSKDLMSNIEYYGDALRGKDKVRIIAQDGTDLSFTIKGRPVLLDDPTISAEDVARGDVGLNIPCGEVFVAPLETTANGTIVFDEVALPGFGKVMNLKLQFAEGRVVEVSAADGADRFHKFLDANTGDKDRIAELGIGCNPGAKYTGGSIIVDEKIYGTVHIAIGGNAGSYHGINRASSHLDMIKNMEQGELQVDGKPVMKNGLPAR